MFTLLCVILVSPASAAKLVYHDARTDNMPDSQKSAVVQVSHGSRNKATVETHVGRSSTLPGKGSTRVTNYGCRCHDAVEDHPLEHANRMLCGFCKHFLILDRQYPSWV
nr:hypothetical protein CFP56_32226 [Quercus suber]